MSHNLDERTQTIMRDAIIIDAHGHTLDLAYRTGKRLHHPLGGLTDVPLMRAGGVTAQVSACYVPDVETLGSDPRATHRPLQLLLQMVDYLHREVENDAGAHLRLATCAQDIEEAKRSGKCALILGIEGADPLKGDVRMLRILYRLGLRHVLLGHEGRNAFAMSNASWTGGSWREYDPDLDGPGGLTPVGKELVREMNRLGMLVDVSHLVEASFWDVLDQSDQPVVATHSNTRALADCLRNLTDEQIVAIAESGGVVCATAMRLCPDVDSSVEAFLDHVDHMVKLVGPAHVGFGTDFCKGGYLPQDFEDIGKTGNLVKGLLDRGYSDTETRGIFGENLLRVFRAVA